MSCVIVSEKPWAHLCVDEVRQKSGEPVQFIAFPKALTVEALAAIQPRYVFFLHWSSYIPAAIYDAFPCVVFHMTDLPFGRGGSPLQNLIARGIYQTKLSALRCVKELDAGPVYLKKDVSLYGSAEEIYIRTTQLATEMILEILQTDPIPQPQEGVPVVFKRRRPEEGNISEFADLSKVFHWIRMLDAEGYPPAFLETGGLRLTFRRAALHDGYVEADVKIYLRGKENEE